MTGTEPGSAIHLFQGSTANDAWLSAISAFGQDGVAVRQDGRDGATREILHATLVVEDPRQRWVSSRRPPLNPAFAIAETLWMIWGRNDEALPVFFSNSYRRFSGPGPTYGGAYGDRLRRSFGLDQLERAADALGANSESRQVVLQIWSAADDMPNTDGSPRRADIPCNLISMLKVRAGRLHWTQVLRSNDFILGLPYNFVQFTTLQEILAGWLGVRLGPYTHLSDSLHVYERDLGAIALTENASSAINNDVLALPLEQSRIVLEELERRVDALIHPALTQGHLQEILEGRGLPRSYANLLSIMCAESARRRRWADVSDHCAAACTNGLLSELWVNWSRRLAGADKSRSSR